MDIQTFSRKDIGNLGEQIVCEYLRRLGFSIVAKNVSRKSGELDIVARKEGVLHVVEVKAVTCVEFPQFDKPGSGYDPAWNLHASKIKKVVRTARWYVTDQKWVWEWQVDGALVWLRKSDGMAKVRYYPQIV